MQKFKVVGNYKLNSFIRGVVAPVLLIFENKKNFFISLGVVISLVVLTIFTNGILTPAFALVCLVTGSIQITRGIKRIRTSRSVTKVAFGYEEAGAGCFSVFIAVLTAIPLLKAHYSGQNITNLSLRTKVTESIDAAIGSLDDIACLLSSMTYLGIKEEDVKN